LIENHFVWWANLRVRPYGFCWLYFNFWKNKSGQPGLAPASFAMGYAASWLMAIIHPFSAAAEPAP